MTTAQIALSVIMIIASLFLIVVVLLQEGAQQGLGAIEGGADTFFGKGKASASDRIFARLDLDRRRDLRHRSDRSQHRSLKCRRRPFSVCCSFCSSHLPR